MLGSRRKCLISAVTEGSQKILETSVAPQVTEEGSDLWEGPPLLLVAPISDASPTCTPTGARVTLTRFGSNSTWIKPRSKG